MTTTRGGAERVELYRSPQDRLWYFRRVAANNEVVADSEGYQNRADAIVTAHRLFPDVATWINDGGVWMSDMVSEDDLPEKTGAIEDEELLDPQPEPEQPEGAEEDGPDPTIGPAEDEAEDEG